MDNVGRVNKIHGAKLIVQDGDDVVFAQLCLGHRVHQLLKVRLHILHDNEQELKHLEVDGELRVTASFGSSSNACGRCALLAKSGVLLANGAIGHDDLVDLRGEYVVLHLGKLS